LEGEIKYHPRQCHLCKYNGVNALLSERGLPICEEAKRACETCQYSGESNDGVSWVHIDAADNPATVYNNRTAPLYQIGGKRDFDAVKSPCNPEERERYLRILQMISEISWDDAGLLSCLLRGMRIKDIAIMRGCSYESIYYRWERMKKRNPAFLALINGMMGSGCGRKPTKSIQCDLFEDK